jgi:type IV secretory pathway VirB6-like protein
MAVTNAIGISFVDIASTRMATIQTVLDAALAAEVNILTPILRALFVIYIGRQFLLCMGGHLSIQRFFDTILKSGIIILLVTHNGAFVQYVRDPVFNKVPQALSAMVAGNYGATTANQPLAAQFDSISAKGDAITTAVYDKASNWWSMSDWISCIAASINDGIFQVILALIVGIWLLGQSLLAIILAIGLPILCFELFDRTRGFVDQWIGKIVGFAAFGFATSIVLAFEIQGLKTQFDALHTAATTNAVQAVSMYWHVLGNSLLDLLTIAILPGAVGFGSGAAAALGAPSAMLVMRSLSLASGGVGMAASRAATALSRAAGRINRISRS